MRYYNLLYYVCCRSSWPMSGRGLVLTASLAMQHGARISPYNINGDGVLAKSFGVTEFWRNGLLA
eukprot:12784578-Heterocapsa_arctica.AAC.1